MRVKRRTILAAGWMTDICLRIVAPSLVIVTSPLPVWIILSIPRGPRLVRTASATARSQMSTGVSLSVQSLFTFGRDDIRISNSIRSLPCLEASLAHLATACCSSSFAVSCISCCCSVGFEWIAGCHLEDLILKTKNTMDSFLSLNV